MRIPNRTLIIVLPLVLALAVAACERAPDTSAGEWTADEQAEFARVELTVAGMDCAGCVLATRTALRRLEGVRDVGVDFESIEFSPAWALYDPEQVTPERMIEAIGKLGYTATVVEAR